MTTDTNNKNEVSIQLTLAELKNVLHKQIIRNQKRIDAAKGDLHRANQAPLLFAETELLKTKMHAVRLYDEEVKIMDYSLHPPQEKKICLQKGIPIQKQIDKRYHEAKRLSLAGPKIKKRIEELEQLQKQLCNLWQELTEKEVPPHVLEEKIAACLAFLKQQRLGDFGLDKTGQIKEKKRPLLPYRTYFSSTGRMIWLGKGARQNDQLTFKHASPHATWLHAVNWQGAHVVVQKKRGEQLDEVTLKEAALLAAYFSKAPSSDWVEIAWTEVKFLRKPKKSPAGSVLLQREKHIRIRPTKEAVDAIIQRGEDRAIP